MQKVTINSQKQGQYWLEFQTLAEAEAYKAECIANEKWGKNAYTEIIPATETEPEQTIDHPAEYTITIEDITAEVEKERKLQDRIKKQEFGAKFMAEVLELIDRKVAAGELSQGDLIAMESSADLMLIEKCAWRGMIDTLKGLVTNYTGIYYTQADKDYLVDLIVKAGF